MKNKCKTCGLVFEFKPDKTHKGKYCSRKCYIKGRWGKGRKIIKQCEICNKDFKTYKSVNKRFCSRQCKVKWQKTITGSIHPAYKGIINYGNGYNALFMPQHPQSDSKGYVLEHRYIMETKLGRFLEKEEIVHHLNGDKKDNNLSNLELTNNKDHSRRHTQERWSRGDMDKVMKNRKRTNQYD